MAYLILSTDGREWDRRELRGPVVVGRSPECDVSIHDILLSRRHCQINPSHGGWMLIDLGSRNGTHVADQVIEQCKLNHGDSIRVGRTRITFRDEKFVPAASRTARPQVPPALGREEALAGTVAGMVVPAESIPAQRGSIHRPSPKPRPMDPVSFESDDLYSMLEQIASSSWDSIYAANSRPLLSDRLPPQPIVAGHSRLRQKTPTVSFSLQAIPTRPMMASRKPTTLAQRTWKRLSQIISRARPATAPPVRG